MSSTAAERQRECRRRARRDLLALRVDLPAEVIADAMDRGDLPISEPIDRDALSRLVLRALRTLAQRENIATT